MLRCHEEEVEGQLRLANDLSVLCDTPQHSTYVAMGVLGLLLYGLGYPLLVCYLLRTKLGGANNSTLAFLIEGYEIRVAWWEATILLRKFLLQILVVFVPDLYMQVLT